MRDTGTIQHVADLIHMSVAPIFLLTAVAATLTVFAGRLARIVDRGRYLEREPQGGPGRREEMLNLERRARLIYVALCLGVLAAILIAVLMTLVFAGSVLNFEAAGTVALLFIASLFAYTGALICLLREVFLAVATFNLGLQAAGGK